ncbi:MAG: xylulokinase [Oscillospiraceae bacterium]
MTYLIGVDVGTSGTKSVLFDEKGNIIGTSSAEYELIQPQNGWAEQKPVDFKNATLKTLKDLAKLVNPSDIKGVGVSGQMHGLVILDEKNEPLCNSLIWCDQRTENEVKEIENKIGRENYISLTLNVPNTSFTLSKLLWIKNNRHEIYDKINKILLPKDYINFCICGNFSTDVSDASGTGYFDVRKRAWSEEILNSFEINKNLLPKVFESCDVVGNVTAEIAKETGLSTSTIVVAGAGDQAAAALGNGVCSGGDMSISLGTSGVVFSAVNEPLYDDKGRIHTFCHAIKNMWHIMGVTQGCGLSVSWFKQNFAESVSYKELDMKAMNKGSNGAMFLPYLMGERTPHLDPNCRGAFIGISASHDKINLYKAVLEGCCFSLKECYDIILNIGLEPRHIQVCGGGANSDLWLQILSDTLARTINKSENSESGARGVAMLAGVGVKTYKDVKTANENMNSVSSFNISSNEQMACYYNDIFPIYKNLYHSIKQCNNKLLKITRENYDILSE